MAAETPAVSVVTPTFNRPDRAERLLDALAAVEAPPGGFEVVVVDNGSGDDTTERLLARVATSPFPLRPLRVEVNHGPARARNLGWQEAAAPFIAYVDDDCLPDPGWLVAGVRRLGSDPELGVVQGRTRMPPEYDGQALSAWTVRRDITGPTAHFEGCNVFYRREALAATGGFDEEIGWWGEDAAAGWRVVESGWLRGFEPDAVVTHDVEVRDLVWHLKNNYLERNLVRLAAKHPLFRDEYFWRPWAVQRETAALTIGVAGLVAARWWRPAALAVLPYLWWRRPSVRQPGFFRTGARNLLFDGARAVGHLAGSVRAKTLVL
jgi:glycosyltransferase involved in cell wall biosynthesis